LTRRVLVTVPPLPPRWRAPLKPDDYGAYCLRLKSKGSASRFSGCRGYIRVHFRCGPFDSLTAPKAALSMGYSSFGLLL
jgi:hypothetical protein